MKRSASAQLPAVGGLRGDLGDLRQGVAVADVPHDDLGDPAVGPEGRRATAGPAGPGGRASSRPRPSGGSGRGRSGRAGRGSGRRPARLSVDLLAGRDGDARRSRRRRRGIDRKPVPPVAGRLEAAEGLGAVRGQAEPHALELAGAGRGDQAGRDHHVEPTARACCGVWTVTASLPAPRAATSSSPSAGGLEQVDRLADHRRRRAAARRAPGRRPGRRSRSRSGPRPPRPGPGPRSRRFMDTSSGRGCRPGPPADPPPGRPPTRAVGTLRDSLPRDSDAATPLGGLDVPDRRQAQDDRSGPRDSIPTSPFICSAIRRRSLPETPDRPARRRPTGRRRSIDGRESRR